MVRGNADAKFGVRLRGGIGWDKAAGLWFDTITKGPRSVDFYTLSLAQSFYAARWSAKAKAVPGYIPTPDDPDYP